MSHGVVQSHNIAVRAGHLQHIGIRVMHSVRSWAVWVYHRADDGWVLGELLVRVRVRGGLDQRNRGAVSLAKWMAKGGKQRKREPLRPGKGSRTTPPGQLPLALALAVGAQLGHNELARPTSHGHWL